MSKRRRIKPTITDNDRFGMTFFLATIFHGMVILGVTFSVSPTADSKTSQTLDIILVQTKSPNDVKKADFLAQVSQRGGGNAEKKERPRELFSAPTLSNKPAVATHTSKPQARKQKQDNQLAFVTQKHGKHTVTNKKNSHKAEKETVKNEANTSENTETARLAAELSSIIEEQASIDRTRYLNSSTREFIPAKYMRDWINRVERIGNLNYPDQARRKKLSGTLILDVVINADGKLIKTDLRQSSGHQILDDAAIRIVQLAAPFSAFPDKLHKEADVIHITRSWEFNNSSVRTR